MGTHFDLMRQKVQAAMPVPTVLSVKLGQSGEIREAFVRGEIDLAVVRGETSAATGEDLGLDPLHWCTAPGWQRPDGPLPVILLPPPCGVRAVAVKALDRAGISWREAFVGGSCMALIAAVQAGLGVAPLGQAVAASMVRSAILDDLPPLPAFTQLVRSDLRAMGRGPKDCVTGISSMLLMFTLGGRLATQ